MRNKWRDLKKETMSAAQRKAARKLTDRYLAEIEIRDLVDNENDPRFELQLFCRDFQKIGLADLDTIDQSLTANG